MQYCILQYSSRICNSNKPSSLSQTRTSFGVVPNSLASWAESTETNKRLSMLSPEYIANNATSAIFIEQLCWEKS